MAGQGYLPRDTGYIACGYRRPSFVLYVITCLFIDTDIDSYCNWVCTRWHLSV